MPGARAQVVRGCGSPHPLPPGFQPAAVARSSLASRGDRFAGTSTNGLFSGKTAQKWSIPLAESLHLGTLHLEYRNMRVMDPPLQAMLGPTLASPSTHLATPRHGTMGPGIPEEWTQNTRPKTSGRVHRLPLRTVRPRLGNGSLPGASILRNMLWVPADEHSQTLPSTPR